MHSSDAASDAHKDEKAPAPALLAVAGAAIAALDLFSVTFANFADFARVLRGFAALEELRCCFVKWTVLGQVPGFMTRPGRGGFLERLRTLDVSLRACSLARSR